MIINNDVMLRSQFCCSFNIISVVFRICRDLVKPTDLILSHAYFSWLNLNISPLLSYWILIIFAEYITFKLLIHY